MICKYLTYMIILMILHISPLRISCQKAILFSSSIGYYNYRQTSNTLKVYHKLKEYGFTDEDIILMIPQNSGCCQKNPLYGSVSFIDNNYDNLNYDVEIDYDYTDINVGRVIDILRGKFNQNYIGKVKFGQQQQPQTLFVYITGHGGNTYFKIRQRQAVIMENFQHLFQDLTLSQTFSKILLFSDSCSAITPFQTTSIQNFTAFASSSWDQKSQSHGFDPLLNSPKSDDFTFYLMEYLQANDPRHKSIKLQELLEYMSFDKLKVHSKIVGKGKRNTLEINQFIIKKPKKIIKKQFRLQSII